MFVCLLACLFVKRVYGTAWLSEEQLESHLLKQLEARRRDHRVLGRTLGLFSIQEDAGGGLVFWHPKGAVVRKLIEDYWKAEHEKVNPLPHCLSSLILPVLSFLCYPSCVILCYPVLSCVILS